MGIASGETGEMGVVSEIADQGVLMVVVHVRDDSVLCCFICALGGFVLLFGLHLTFQPWIIVDVRRTMNPCLTTH